MAAPQQRERWALGAAAAAAYLYLYAKKRQQRIEQAAGVTAWLSAGEDEDGCGRELCTAVGWAGGMGASRCDRPHLGGLSLMASRKSSAQCVHGKRLPSAYVTVSSGIVSTISYRPDP